MEVPGLEINIFIKGIYQERTGLGQGTQIEKSSSRALEAPMLEINTFVKSTDKEQRFRITEQK